MQRREIPEMNEKYDVLDFAEVEADGDEIVINPLGVNVFEEEMVRFNCLIS